MRFFVQDQDNMKRLYDASATGKKRDWREKKCRALLMAEHFYHAGDRFQIESMEGKADRMEDCANYLVFKLTDQGLKLYQAFFCKVRLCPMCNWRRSLKISWQNKRIVEKANQDYKLRWLFLTLTVRNCDGDQLKGTIEDMMKAWNRFMGYKRIKLVVQGYFRALEITKNWEHGTYHPHFHVLMCVPPSYFSKHKYIKQSDWKAFWRRAMRLDYDPVVDIRPVRPKKERPDLERIENEIKQAIREQKAIQEVSKYPIKDADILPVDELTSEGIETVYTLDNAVAHKRLIGYGGILREIRRELELDDPEDGDLIRTTDEDPIANGIAEVTAYWHIGIKDYVIYDKDIRDLGSRGD